MKELKNDTICSPKSSEEKEARHGGSQLQFQGNRMRPRPKKKKTEGKKGGVGERKRDMTHVKGIFSE